MMSTTAKSPPVKGRNSPSSTPGDDCVDKLAQPGDSATLRLLIARQAKGKRKLVQWRCCANASGRMARQERPMDARDRRNQIFGWLSVVAGYGIALLLIRGIFVGITRGFAGRPPTLWILLGYLLFLALAVYLCSWSGGEQYRSRKAALDQARGSDGAECWRERC
jgi:hypothetical protein